MTSVLRAGICPAALLLALIVGGVLTGCGDDPAEPPRECAQGDSYEGAITVAGGTAPRFDWTPACRVNEVHVGDISDSALPFPEAIMWNARTVGNRIPPGVRYGRAPEGAFEEYGPAKPLVAGRRYMVAVFARSSLGDLIVVNVAEFTPEQDSR